MWSTPHRILLSTMLAAILSFACSPPSDSENDVGQEQVSETVCAEGCLDVVEIATDALGRDAVETLDDLSKPPSECLESMLSDTPFTLFPELPLTQIHAAIAFDGEGVWVVFNLPDEHSEFDVWAARLGCDGTPLVAPFQVNNAWDYNETEPDLAIFNDQVLILWQSDSGQFPDNLSIHYRLFQIDGTPLMEQDTALGWTDNGIPAAGNAWMPKAASTPSGGFVLAITGVVGSYGFQTFLQRMSAQGELLGDRLHIAPEEAVGQFYPSLQVLPDATTLVAWVRSPTEGSDRVQACLVDAEFVGCDPENPWSPATESETGAPFAAGAVAASSSGFLVYHEAEGAGSRIRAVEATFSDSPQGVTLGAPGELNHSPVLAIYDQGAALLWYRVISGIRNDVRLGAFRPLGDSYVAPTPIRSLNENSAAPYAPAFVHIDGSRFLAVWSEGTSPDFQLVGRFVQLD